MGLEYVDFAFHPRGENRLYAYFKESRFQAFRPQQMDLGFKQSQAQSCMEHKSSILE